MRPQNADAGRAPLFVVRVQFGGPIGNDFSPWSIVESKLTRRDMMGMVDWNSSGYTTSWTCLDNSDGLFDIHIEAESESQHVANSLALAHQLIGHRGCPNAIILLFHRRKVEPQAFAGAEEFISRVPVHTFRVGTLNSRGKTVMDNSYDDVLRAIAANSPGGTFNALVSEYDHDDGSFSRLMDRILSSDREEEIPPRRRSGTNSGREGQDLVAVMAVGSSMQGSKGSKVEAAMHLLISNLAAVDRLSVVVYDDGAFVLSQLHSISSQAARDKLNTNINRLLAIAAGGNNMKAALDTAVAVIDNRVHGRNRPATIFLMSDGLQQVNLFDERDDVNYANYNYGDDDDDGSVNYGDDDDDDESSSFVPNFGGGICVPIPNFRVGSIVQTSTFGGSRSVPIHTFSIGRDANQQVLRAVAKSSPGGTFNILLDGRDQVKPLQLRLDAMFNMNNTTPSANAFPFKNEDKPPTRSAAGSGTAAAAAVPPRTDNTKTTMDDDEKPPAPSSGSNMAGLVTMKRPMYSKKNVALTADSVNVVVEIHAETSPAVREGLDLVVVLDVSSRMDKDMLARVKKAMEFVIKKLTPMDRLCIVTFADGATRHSPLRCMTAAAQTGLKAILDGLKAPGGGANIKAGIDTALAVVSRRKHTKGRTANIFLMSNGVQSTGGDVRLVDVGSVPVFTFGIGKYADNVLLSTIARKSAGGTFSTVQEGADLTPAMAELLAGTVTVVAQDVELSLKPNRKEKHLDSIVVAPGLDYDQTVDEATGKITVKFGALFSGETRKVVVNMSLMPTIISEDDEADDQGGEDDDEEEGEEEDVKLADVKLSYTRQGDKDSGIAPRLIQIQRTPHPAPAAAGDNNRLWVLAELARRKHAETIRQVRELAEMGKLDAAKDMLMDALNDLENIMVDGGQKLVDTLREELRQLLALMDNKVLYNERGRPYALACEISHSRQRFAAKGDDSRSFATYRMDTHRDEAIRFVKDLANRGGRYGR